MSDERSVMTGPGAGADAARPSAETGFGPLAPRASQAPQTPAAAASQAPAEGVTYEQASARLEAIIQRLDSGDAGLRETLELCREGRELVAFCAAELEAVGAGLDELRLDELVARLAA